MSVTGLARADNRSVDRDAVHHRARGVDALGRPLRVLIVNLSPHGLMARCEQSLHENDMIALELPVVGQIGARVRWALGGRIGCHFDTTMPLARYYELLALLLEPSDVR